MKILWAGMWSYSFPLRNHQIISKIERQSQNAYNMRIIHTQGRDFNLGVNEMNITLGKEFERRIGEKVSEGLYTSASEVIRDGLRLLFEKDRTKQEQLEILRQEVLKGFEQLAAGETSNRSVIDIFEKVNKETNV